MKRLYGSQIALAACAALAFGVSSPTIASADTYSTFDVDGAYDGGLGTVTGSFTLDTTTNTSYAIDLTVVGAGGVNSGTITNPALAAPGTYATADGPMLTYDEVDPALQIALTYPAGGGTLYTGGFGQSQVVSDFSTTCTNGAPDCTYALSGTVTLASDVSTTPLPAALPLFAGGLGMIGLISQRRKRKNIVRAA
jgi:hypothetical protein